MKKIILFSIFIFLFILDTLPTDKKNDSIYHDLCSFLVSRKDITKEYMEEFKDSYSSLIKISDITDSYTPGKTPDLTKVLGVYEFDFIGRESGSTYILIINRKTYKIFRKSDIFLIIKEFLIIREENPSLMSLELFNAYLKGLIKFEIEEDILSYPVSKNTSFIMSGK